MLVQQALRNAMRPCVVRPRGCPLVDAVPCRPDREAGRFGGDVRPAVTHCLDEPRHHGDVGSCGRRGLWKIHLEHQVRYAVEEQIGGELGVRVVDCHERGKLHPRRGESSAQGGRSAVAQQLEDVVEPGRHRFVRIHGTNLPAGPDKQERPGGAVVEACLLPRLADRVRTVAAPKIGLGTSKAHAMPPATCRTSTNTMTTCTR